MRERNPDPGLRTLAENGRGRERGRTLASLSSIKQGGLDSGMDYAARAATEEVVLMES